MPAGFQYIALASLITDTTLSPIPVARAPAPIFKADPSDIPVLSSPKEGRIWALSSNPCSRNMKSAIQAYRRYFENFMSQKYRLFTQLDMHLMVLFNIHLTNVIVLAQLSLEI
jgi:hypothetical protein